MTEDPTDESDDSDPVNGETADGGSDPDGGEVTISASLGASAVLEIDTVDVETATVRTERITADGETVGVELGLEIGPVDTECVLNPNETAALAAELAALSAEMSGDDGDDRDGGDEGGGENSSSG